MSKHLGVSERLLREVPRAAQAAIFGYAAKKAVQALSGRDISREELQAAEFRAIRAEAERNAAVSQTQALEQEIQEQAMRDPKFPIYGNTNAYLATHTHLVSARSYVDAEHHRPEDADNEELRDSHALGLLDLDGFKGYNDKHGHVAGDAVLLGIGEFLRENVRENDLVFREGGDELGVLLRHTTIQDAQITLKTLVQGINDLGFNGVTASAGVSAIDLDTDAIENKRRADNALYQAKGLGGNCVVVYGEDLPVNIAGSD